MKFSLVKTSSLALDYSYNSKSKISSYKSENPIFGVTKDLSKANKKNSENLSKFYSVLAKLLNKSSNLFSSPFVGGV